MDLDYTLSQIYLMILSVAYSLKYAYILQSHCFKSIVVLFFHWQVVATDADLAEPYNLVVYDTAGTARAEQYFDVDVTSGIIFVKRDLRFPTSQTSEMFVLDIQVGIADIFIHLSLFVYHVWR